MAAPFAAEPLEIFEELRYVWEYMAAALVFLVPFAQPRPHAVAKVVVGFLGFSLISLLYFPILDVVSRDGLPLLTVGFWYMVLAFLMTLFFRRCFELALADALYMMVNAYAAQHVVYVVIHEWLALDLWPSLPSMFTAYVLISELSCVVWYGALYWVFGRRLRAAGGRILEDSRKGALSMALLLMMFLACSFGFQYLFHLYEANQSNAVWMSLLVCFIVLGQQYMTLGATLEARELATTEQMLRDAEEHWKLSNDLVENLNRTIHDLKHVVGALEQLPERDRAGYVNETTEYIRRYEQTVYTDDEVLNTIISEKALLCENRGVAFSCSLGKVDLSFVALPDLYVLLGNIVSNAVEGALTVGDPGLRAVTLAIRERGGLACITCDNPFEGEREVGKGGLLATTKADASRHGYGLKSIRATAQKYGGTMFVSAEEGVFTLQVALPLP